MQAILGVFFHFLGGFASGSFYMPYKKVKGWAWESYWIIGGIFSWVIVPPLIAYLTIPGFTDVIASTNTNVLLITFCMGLLWGIGGLTYGLGIRFLGMSLGNSIILGFCSAFGALMPAFYNNLFPKEGSVSFTDMLQSNSGLLILLGVFICVLGIAICGKAGMMKEKELSTEQKQATIKEFSLAKGLILAVISGILSSFFNFGLTFGQPMAHEAVARGMNPLFQNNVIFVVILWGGLLPNLISSILLNVKNKTFSDYTNKQTPLASNYLFSALAGTTWFMQLFFFGMGASKLGNGASSWILHMAFIILTANMWGIILKEWKGVSNKAKITVAVGIATIILSIMIVTYSSS